MNCTFSVVFNERDSFVTFCLFPENQVPFEKMVYSKWKEFAPTGSKFFPFKVDPFSEGNFFLKDLSPLKVYQVPLNRAMRKRVFANSQGKDQSDLSGSSI